MGKAADSLGWTGKVVVITGTSSGLGRAAAIRFAERGANVIVAARGEDGLRETVRLCQARGGVAQPCVADVCVETDVRELARFALERGRRIDVWVNNAGVTAFGPLEMESFTDHRRVIEVNLFGAILGARVVLPVFRRQTHGILINVGSVLSKIGQPFVPSYVISKFGLDGLSEAVRAEVADVPGIRVCTLYPYAMNTPHFESAANHLGKVPYAMPPDQDPDEVALALVELAQAPRRHRYVPRLALLGLALHALAPRTTERLLQDALTTWHLSDAAETTGQGNLYRPHSGPRSIAGGRPPRLSTRRLLLWLAQRLLRLQAANAKAWAHRLVVR